MFENPGLYDMPICLHKCMTLQFVTSKCSLKVRFPQTSVEKEAWAVMRQSAFHWSVPAESFCIYVTITMKYCHLSISRDHRLFKSIFTNVIINSVSLLERGLLGGVSFFPLKAGLHYWLQKRKCNLVPVLWLSANWAHFHLLFQQSGIYILWDHIHKMYLKWMDLMV